MTLEMEYQSAMEAMRSYAKAFWQAHHGYEKMPAFRVKYDIGFGKPPFYFDGFSTTGELDACPEDEVPDDSNIIKP